MPSADHLTPVKCVKMDEGEFSVMIVKSRVNGKTEDEVHSR
jgi:hypothetical protein